MTSGRILHLQRLSTEDGPGIRTTVFFKGCPLQCAWCHNPESIAREQELQWFAVRCLGCGTCVEACPEKCLQLTSDGLRIDRDVCTVCGTCTQACPSGAIEMIGKTMQVSELIKELEKDRAYYEKSGGGVTLSGGEPTYQPDFAKALLQGLKEKGISTALDTCGLTTQHVLASLLPFTDLVLFDLKLFNNALHKKYTGQSNKRIQENLLFIRDWIIEDESDMELWIRTPLIPAATDSEENLKNIGQFITRELNGVVSRWDLCAFNNLCRDQYARLGLEWEFTETELMTKDNLSRCEQNARSVIRNPEVVHVTGAARIE